MKLKEIRERLIFVAVFAVLVAALVQHALGVNDKLEKAGVAEPLPTLPPVMRFDWPSLDRAGITTAPAVVVPHRDLFEATAPSPAPTPPGAPSADPSPVPVPSTMVDPYPVSVPSPSPSPTESVSPSPMPSSVPTSLPSTK